MEQESQILNLSIRNVHLSQILIRKLLLNIQTHLILENKKMFCFKKKLIMIHGLVIILRKKIDKTLYQNRKRLKGSMGFIDGNKTESSSF
jgi:hypothetical protein